MNNFRLRNMMGYYKHVYLYRALIVQHKSKFLNKYK